LINTKKKTLLNGRLRTNYFRVNIGIGDAGKSTFAKQMKVLHKNGFSPTEFDRFKNVIHDNVITSMRQILDFAEKHDLTPKKLQVSDNQAILGSPLPDLRTKLNFTLSAFSIAFFSYHILYSCICR
jgi:hypothetical protein